MAIIVSRTYQFLKNTVSEIQNPPPYVNFSERDKKIISSLVSRLEESRKDSRFVNAGNVRFSGSGFSVQVSATMAEVQSDPAESKRIINGFHGVFSRYNVPPDWYKRLGEVVYELGIAVSPDFHKAISYGASMQGCMVASYLGPTRSSLDDISMNWALLKKEGITEYVPF